MSRRLERRLAELAAAGERFTAAQLELVDARVELSKIIAKSRNDGATLLSIAQHLDLPIPGLYALGLITSVRDVRATTGFPARRA